MAAKTLYATNTILSSTHQEMSETSPGSDATASPVVGWVVGTTGAGNYSSFDAGTEAANGTFSATIQPDTSINTGANAGDCLRSTNTYSGTFANANWTFHFTCIAVTVGGAQDGNVGIRIWRSANADGSGATQLTAARLEGGAVTNLATSAQQTSTVTFSPGATITLTNEYLFVQIGWEITGAGGMSTSDVDMRIGTTATRLITSDFTAAYSVPLAQGSYSLTGQAVTLQGAHQLALAQGSYSLSGQAVTFQGAHLLTAAQGSYTLNGQDLTLTPSGQDPVLTAAQGSYVLTGQSINLNRGFSAILSQGSYVLTGFSTNFIRSLQAPLATGFYSITGQSITLTYSGGSPPPLFDDYMGPGMHIGPCVWHP